MNILAIDPGNTESGWAIIDSDTRKPLEFGKWRNEDLIKGIRDGLFESCDAAAIEMVASYGMAVGADVFETCVWIGRFTEAIRLTVDAPPQPCLIKRHPVKLHHCHSGNAKDSNVTQALVDRFALGQPNHGKGTKADPGWFYGFKADIWQAYALAVFVADVNDPEQVA